jgi:hypothetical protein
VPRLGGEACIEVGGGALGAADRHRVRAHVCVDGVAHGSGIVIVREIEMRDLAGRVNARIGAAGAL